MKKVLRSLCAILALLPLAAFSQTISTLAPPGSGMDDDMVLDSAGNLYAAGYDDGNVYRVTPGGSVSVYATGFGSANGLEWDHLGNLVVCDNTGDAIYKIAPDSTISLFVSINSPSGITKDPLSDTLYFTSYLGHTIWKLAPDSNMVMVTQGSPMNGPVGLEWDENDNLLVGNFTDRKVHRISRSGAVSYIGQFPFSGPLGFIAYDDGYMYGTLFNANRIYRMDTLGTTQYVAGGFIGQIDGSVDTARFNRPNGIIFSQGGDSLFVTDYGAKSVRVITGLDSIGIVGIEDLRWSDLSLTAYPNPVSERLMVDYELPLMDEKTTVRMIDNMGREVYRKVLENSAQGTIQINTSQLAKGNYHLILEAGEIILREKIQVQ